MMQVFVLIRKKKEKNMKPLTLESLCFCAESFDEASLYGAILLRRKNDKSKKIKQLTLESLIV